MTLLPQHAKVFLVGFMGSGKTTLGQLLSDRLQWDFYDIDTLIEELEKRPILRIFAERGEPYFRTLEQRSLSRLSPLPRHAVIACGGGTFATFENQALMRRHGITVWLDQPFDQIWARRDSLAAERPLMGTESSVRRLYEQRAASYRLATIRFPVADGDLPGALEALLTLLRERFAIQ